MNITVFSSSGNVYSYCECINGFAFKNVTSWVKCALLPVICAGFALSQDSCAHFGRIECLLPHNSCA